MTSPAATFLIFSAIFVSVASGQQPKFTTLEPRKCIGRFSRGTFAFPRSAFVQSAKSPLLEVLSKNKKQFVLNAPSHSSRNAILPTLSNPSHSPQNHALHSFLISYDESIPIYQAEEAFQDQVILSDLTSDPTLQAAFAASVVAVVVLFVLKSVVTQMDNAVEKVALDFDRMMSMKYPKKWKDFMTEDESVGVGEARNDIDADRIQKIVEEMERLSNEEPEFMERAMRELKRTGNQ